MPLRHREREERVAIATTATQSSTTSQARDVIECYVERIAAQDLDGIVGLDAPDALWEVHVPLVPSFFTVVPDTSLESEWRLFRTVQFDEGPIPNKYRDLIGSGIAAATKCQYCIQYHTEVAKPNGATDAEIEDAVHLAKLSAGWSTYLNGMQVAEYVRSRTLATVAD